MIQKKICKKQKKETVIKESDDNGTVYILKGTYIIYYVYYNNLNSWETARIAHCEDKYYYCLWVMYQYRNK